MIAHHNQYKTKRKFCIVKFDQKLAHFDETFVEEKRDSYPVYILEKQTGRANYNQYSFKGVPTENLPYQIFYTKGRDYVSYTHPQGKSMKFLYDHHENQIIIVLTEDHISNVIHIELWQKESDIWVLKRKATTDIDIYFEACMINRLECTRRNIIFEMNKRIYIIDKRDLKHINNFKGRLMSCIDDYDEWYDEKLELLKKTIELDKLNVSLLKIILSYVS